MTEGSCDTDMLAGAAAVRQNKNPPHVTAEWEIERKGVGGRGRRQAEVTALSDTGTVLIWSSSHASLCLPWAISAHSHIHTICPIIPPLYNFSSSPSPALPSPPVSFPSGVLEGYVNGRGGRLRKRWEEWCEKGERRCRGHRWVIAWLRSVCGCASVRECLCLCAFQRFRSAWVCMYVAHLSGRLNSNALVKPVIPFPFARFFVASSKHQTRRREKSVTCTGIYRTAVTYWALLLGLDFNLIPVLPEINNELKLKSAATMVYIRSWDFGGGFLWYTSQLKNIGQSSLQQCSSAEPILLAAPADCDSAVTLTGHQAEPFQNCPHAVWRLTYWAQGKGEWGGGTLDWTERTNRRIAFLNPPLVSVCTSVPTAFARTQKLRDKRASLQHAVRGPHNNCRARFHCVGSASNKHRVGNIEQEWCLLLLQVI